MFAAYMEVHKSVNNMVGVGLFSSKAHAPGGDFSVYRGRGRGRNVYMGHSSE